MRVLADAYFAAGDLASCEEVLQRLVTTAASGESGYCWKANHVLSAADLTTQVTLVVALSKVQAARGQHGQAQRTLNQWSSLFALR